MAQVTRQLPEMLRRLQGTRRWLRFTARSEAAPAGAKTGQPPAEKC